MSLERASINDVLDDPSQERRRSVGSWVITLDVLKAVAHFMRKNRITPLNAYDLVAGEKIQQITEGRVDTITESLRHGHAPESNPTTALIQMLLLERTKGMNPYRPNADFLAALHLVDGTAEEQAVLSRTLEIEAIIEGQRAAIAAFLSERALAQCDANRAGTNLRNITAHSRLDAEYWLETYLEAS